MKHEQAMEDIRKKYEEKLVEIENKDMDKAKKAAKLIKETIQDKKESVKKSLTKIEVAQLNKKKDDFAYMKEMKQQMNQYNERADLVKKLKDDKRKQFESTRFQRDLDHYKALASVERNRNKTEAEMIRMMAEEIQEHNDALYEHEQNRQEQINERVQKVRDHLRMVEQKRLQVLQGEKDQSLVKQITLVEKLVGVTKSSNRTKDENLKETQTKLQSIHEISQNKIKTNLQQLRKDEREKCKYIQTKAKERDQSVKEIRTALQEDIDQKKEITRLRKMDRDEFMSRRNHYETLEKQKIWMTIQEKHSRADSIKHEQDRIAALVTAKRTQAIRNFASSTLSPRQAPVDKKVELAKS